MQYIYWPIYKIPTILSTIVIITDIFNFHHINIKIPVILIPLKSRPFIIIIIMLIYVILYNE